MKINEREFRNVLGQFATGVTVVTTLAEDGTFVGITVNSFASVSLNPPLVLWSLGRSSAHFKDFERCDYFAIHILSERQKELSNLFAEIRDDKFDQLEVSEGISGLPLIAGCSAWLQCRKTATHPGGDHEVLLGQVESLQVESDDPPLLYYRGGYAGLEK